MANAILTKFTDALTTITVTLASLAAAAARASAAITNSNSRPAALIFVKITSGTAPTAGGLYKVYLLRRDDSGTPSYGTDGWVGTDAAITINNAALLGTIAVTNNTNTAFYGEFDTSLLGPLGQMWGIAVVNGSDQALNGTGGNHVVTFRYYYPEVQ